MLVGGLYHRRGRG